MITYNIHHVDGLYFELTGDEGKNREYDVTFIDKTDMELYVKPNKVRAPFRTAYTPRYVA